MAITIRQRSTGITGSSGKKTDNEKKKIVIRQRSTGQAGSSVGESSGGLVDVPQPWLDTITTVTPSSRSASRWSGTTPTSRGGGFGKTESQGEGYFTQSRQSPLERAARAVSSAASSYLGGFANVGGEAAAAQRNLWRESTQESVSEWQREIDNWQRNLDEWRADGTLTDQEEQFLNQLIRGNQERIAQYTTAQRGREETVGAARDLADQWAARGEKERQAASAGLNGLGRLAVDTGIGLAQYAGDVGIGALTGGSAVVPMAIRGFGGGAQQARLDGADDGQAALFGLASAALESVTEGLGSVGRINSRFFGEGALDEIMEGMVAALERKGSTAAGRAALNRIGTAATAFVSEGAEEALSSLVSPILERAIYSDEPLDVGEILGDALYDFAVGGAVGAIAGGAGGTDTTRAQAQARTRLADQAITDAYNEMSRSGMFSPTSTRARAEASGYLDNVSPSARQAVEMLSRGEEISGNQATRIARDPEALSLLQELTGQEINTDAPISQVRSDIRAVAGTRRDTAPVQTQAQENTQAQREAAPAASQEARPAARQVYDTQRVQRASTALGESGQKALSFAYDRSVDADRYYAGFTAYYEAGLSGRARDQVRSDYAADLTEAQRYAAYTAGQNDAAASLQREKRSAKFAQTAGADSGLVYDDFVREAVESGRTVSGENGSGPVYLTQETAERVNSVAKALGLRVRFVDQVDGGRSNAEITGSEVQIEKNNPLPVQFLMGHEVTHRLQELAPEEYRAFREAAAQDEMAQAYVRQYMEGDFGLTYEQALDEASADYAGRLLEDGALLDQFIGRNQDNRTLLEKIRDAIRTLVRRLTGAEKRAAQTAEGKLSAALKAGAKRAETLRERQGDGTMESRYSRKEDGTNGADGQERQFPEGAGPEEAVRRFYAEAEGRGQTVRVFQRNGQTGRGAKSRLRLGRFTEVTADAATETAVQTKAELEALGIPAFIHAGDLEVMNKNGEILRSAEDSATVNHAAVGIANEIQIAPKETAGHEAYHFWKGSSFRQSYSDLVYSEIKWNSPEFFDLYDHINKNYFDNNYDMDDPEQRRAFNEELVAYISGQLHNGEDLSGLLGNPATVQSAWETLVEENRGTQARESRKGFSVDRELDREIRQIVKEAREGGKSEEAVQADIRALVQESYQRMAEQYGTIPAGERPAREARVPRRTAEERVVSQTVRTVLEAGATPEAAIPNIEELTARGVFSYTRYTDKQAMEDAEGVIRDKGYATALSDWTSRVRRGEVSKANTAEGWALYNQAANSGDVKSAMTILTNMVEHQRNAAQAVQATRILKQLSPDAQLYGVERSMRNLQEELTRRYGKNAPDLKIDEELAGRFLSARTQKARDEAMQELYRDIGRQMPSRFVDKWNAWRYLAMLGNPRTHVRNVVGNAFFAPVVATKNLTATAIEAAAARVSRGRMGRSKRLVGFGKKDRALLSAAWADFANVEEQILGSGKYSDSANANRYIQEGRVIFRNKALETARRGNSAALDLEDTWFSKPHYAYALAQYAKANGLTAAQLRNGRGLDGARAYAIREAQKATYRDTNAFSQMISGLGRYQGNNPVKKASSVILEGILPFRKTPANILVRGVEYSPLGLLKSLTYDLAQVRAGEKTAAEAIDGIAAGLSGTGLMALGVLLAAEGLVRGSGGGDDDENQYEELMGHQAYSLEVGGQSYTLDWLAPEALPFFVGVNLWEQSGAEEEAPTLSTMINAVGNVTEPLLEMSCLQSLNEVFDAVGYATSEGLGALPSALVSAATSYLTQAVPTILGQAERTSQGERVTTYTEKNAFLTQDMQYTLGSISGRVPGWDYQQIPYIDAWGRTESTGSTAARAFDNFLNPAYRSAIDESPMELALKELYEQTGEGTVLPSRAPRYFNVDGERKDLAAEEYVEYATSRGQTAYVLMEELFQRTDGAGLSDEDMVNAVERVYEYANAQAKTLVSDYEPDGWVKKAMDGAASGVSPIDYTLYELAKEMADAGNSDLEKRNGSIDQSEAEAAIDMLTGLSDEARAYLWQSTNKGWSEKNNPYR